MYLLESKFYQIVSVNKNMQYFYLTVYLIDNKMLYLLVKLAFQCNVRLSRQTNNFLLQVSLELCALLVDESNCRNEKDELCILSFILPLFEVIL